MPTYRRPFVKRRILCIEDHEDSLKILDFILSDAGFVCRTASTCEEARRKIKNRLFDAYVVDHWLPDGWGIDLIGQIRDSDQNTPVIFLSADVRDDVQQQAVRAGACAVLFKPFDPYGLVTVVRQQIADAQLRSIAARMEERAAILDTLTECAAAVAHTLHDARESIRKSHAIRFAARGAFVRGGGNPIDFSRLWEPPNSWSRRKTPNEITSAAGNDTV